MGQLRHDPPVDRQREDLDSPGARPDRGREYVRRLRRGSRYRLGGGNSDGYATIYHTTDGGSTWVRKGSAANLPDVDLTKVHGPDDNHVWAVGGSLSESVILHTSNGGATWTNQLPAGYEGILLQGVYAPDSNTVWVTGGPQGWLSDATQEYGRRRILDSPERRRCRSSGE